MIILVQQDQYTVYDYMKKHIIIMKIFLQRTGFEPTPSTTTPPSNGTEGAYKPETSTTSIEMVSTSGYILYM